MVHAMSLLHGRLCVRSITFQIEQPYNMHHMHGKACSFCQSYRSSAGDCTATEVCRGKDHLKNDLQREGRSLL